MGDAAITRRGALAAGALAGLGTLIARPPGASAAERGTRGFGMAVGAGDFDGATSRVLRAPGRFDLVGVRAEQSLQVRVRRRGRPWSRWIALHGRGEHAPDGGSGERASDPVWAGGCDELQLRVAGAAPRAMRLHFVSAGARTAATRTAVAVAAAAPKQAAPGTPPPIIARELWGGDRIKPREDPSYGKVALAFVHHTATANAYAPEQSAGIILGIAKYHRDTNGWNDLGYNFLIDQYGQVFEGRAGGVDQAVVGAHAQGYNDDSTGVAMIGSHDGTPISDVAMAALAQLLGWKLSLHGVPCEGSVTVRSGGGPLNRYRKGTDVTLQRISGHGDGDATACPGAALAAQLPTLRLRAAALAGPVRARGVVTLAASGSAVLYGADAVFSGAVTRRDSTAGSGALVALQRRARGGPWVTLARTRAEVDGSWSLRMPWRRGGDVRARAAGVDSRVATIGVTPVLTARAPRRRVLSGGSVAMSGRIRPGVSVQILAERRGSDGRYRRSTLIRAQVDGSRWRASVRLRRAGLYRLRARTADGEIGTTPVLVRAISNTGGARAPRE